jgi:hypothetical protein
LQVVVVVRASPTGAPQYVTLDSKIKMSKFICVVLGNPTNKTITGTTNRKPAGLIVMIDQSEILSRSQVQFITFFFGGAQLCCALY